MEAVERKKKPFLTSQDFEGFLYAGPWFFGYLLFNIAPLLFSLMIAFTDWDGVMSVFDKRCLWVGLDNFVKLFTTDRYFYLSIFNTVYYVIGSVPIGIFFGILLATFLNQRLQGISLYRTVYYLPNVVGGVATILMWQLVYQPDYGIFNTIIRFFLDFTHLSMLEINLPEMFRDTDSFVFSIMEMRDIGVYGLKAPGWLNDPHWSKPAFLVMAWWGAAGGHMLIYLAGLQSIPQHLYEAAEIDGANKVQMFFKITIPQLTPTILFTMITGLVGSFQIFDAALLLTNGGPQDSTVFYILVVYWYGLQSFKMGLASAMSWLLMGVMIVIAIAIMRSSFRWVYYGDERGGD
jgi:multiple sugar transport system permease protein